MPRSGGMVARPSSRKSSADSPERPGWTPWIGWPSCIWAPRSTRVFAAVPEATRLASDTWPASSTKRQSSECSRAGSTRFSPGSRSSSARGSGVSKSWRASVAACARSRKETTSPAEKSGLPFCVCNPSPPSLYLEPRAKLNTFCASIYLIVQKLEHGEDYKRREGEKKVERDGHGHGSPPRHAPIAVPDRDHGPIPPEDRIGAAKALGFPRESRVAPEARAGGLVEEDELAAVARPGSAAVIEQGFDRIGPDAALLHAGAGVFREDAGHAHLLLWRCSLVG